MLLDVVILAGGEGRRMGGRDKGLVPFQSQPMVAFAVQLVRPVADRVVISCNRHLPEYAALADQVVEDSLEGFQGPLAGILAGLRVSHSDQVLVLPCDTPLLEAALIERLLAAAAAFPESITVLSEGDKLHPLHAVIPRLLADDLERWLTGGQRAVQRWMRNHPMQLIDISDLADQLCNLNTFQELKSLEALKSER
ncbi:molybdopterin-guanine dinucleotide biosynthesis protein A [Amphritea atlantica]|uniref:Molybdenum cofactor guanylyltransferase n=1 Tax=Amphritea atlantica TaxID=355243 RepID=A0A1H9LSN8_9GAMM|nr:molybdenum cofactor guanylyltransferase MobA [Amphritea atlantica]SER14522.1 molybdopterin-guanine dinucleotide biosynthesis protein A [Amphritea atlantica]